MIPRFARSLLVVSALAAAVAACTGGGGSPGTTGGDGTSGGGGSSARSLAQYVGTWSGCFVSGTTSALVTLKLTAGSSDTVVNFTRDRTDFTSADCTGIGTASPSESGTATSAGPKTIGTDTADKVDLAYTVPSGATGKDLLLIRSDAKLYVGNGTLDTDGYPSGVLTTGMTKL